MQIPGARQHPNDLQATIVVVHPQSQVTVPLSGCLEIHVGAERAQHEAECPFKPFVCGIDGCTHQAATAKDLVHHMTSVHHITSYDPDNGVAATKEGSIFAIQMPLCCLTKYSRKLIFEDGTNFFLWHAEISGRTMWLGLRQMTRTQPKAVVHITSMERESNRSSVAYTSHVQKWETSFPAMQNSGLAVGIPVPWLEAFHEESKSNDDAYGLIGPYLYFALKITAYE